ncbi:hypothetical protein AV521_06270 [Streptomyces sp. IMTB 2501]|nr:hypothetical protein AV521_06270 [Streptomyces sp. IMTB 2501]
MVYEAERIELHLTSSVMSTPHAPRSEDILARETRRFLHRRQKQPRIVRGYFHACRVLYTCSRQNNSSGILPSSYGVHTQRTRPRHVVMEESAVRIQCDAAPGHISSFVAHGEAVARAMQ